MTTKGYIKSGPNSERGSDSDSDLLGSIHEAWGFVFQQGAMLALMPIEEWLEALSKAETLGPVLDPTLYRAYLYSGKGEIIKDVLEAALIFKRAIVKAQAKIRPDATRTDSVPRAVEPPDFK